MNSWCGYLYLSPNGRIIKSANSDEVKTRLEILVRKKNHVIYQMKKHPFLRSLHISTWCYDIYHEITCKVYEVWFWNGFFRGTLLPLFSYKVVTGTNNIYSPVNTRLWKYVNMFSHDKFINEQQLELFHPAVHDLGVLTFKGNVRALVGTTYRLRWKDNCISNISTYLYLCDNVLRRKLFMFDT